MLSDSEFGLTLSQPVISNKYPVVNFSEMATEYSRSISRSGGYYEASWRMPFDEGASAYTADQLREAYTADPFMATPHAKIRGRASNEGALRIWFETPYLMYHVEERAAGALTWEGAIWEMELTLGGLTRRISMENVWNAVRADYTDTAGGRHSTAWYTEDESIALYGRKEKILDERYAGATEAAAAAQSWLAEHAWPQPEVVEIATTRAPGLFVQAVGYCVTANFRHVGTTAADKTTGDISAFISAIVANDCDFLQAGNIETNTLQRKRLFDRAVRCWDAIEELTNMGDASNNPWVVTVYNGQRLNYEQADSTPTLYWRGGQGVTAPAGDLNPWLVRPGVMRDLTGVITSGRPGAFLEQVRDVWVNEVEMSQGRTQPILKPEGFDPNAILRAKDQYLDWMEEAQDA